MPEKDSLSKLLEDYQFLPKSSASEQFTALLNVSKQSNFADQLFEKNIHQLNNSIFDDKEQQRERVKKEPIDPKYTLTNKNFSKLIDKVDELESKNRMLFGRLADLEDSQMRMQEKFTKLNSDTKELKSKPSQKEYGIVWRSFAYGAIVIVCLLFAIHRLL
jgi:hypothetical protein